MRRGGRRGRMRGQVWRPDPTLAMRRGGRLGRMRGQVWTPRVRIVVAPIEPTRGRRRKTTLARYGSAFKRRALTRLQPPENASIEAVAVSIGVQPETLARWQE